MASRTPIRCLAPALLGPVPETLAEATGSAGPFPALEYVLGKSRREVAETADGEALICAIAGGDAAPGALLARGFGIGPGRIGYRAAPVHLRPDRDRLLLFAGDDARPSADEAASIRDDFNRAFAADGIELQTRDGEWLLVADTAPGPDLPSLSRVAGRYLDMVIPDDAATRPWRKLLNEAQMFLYDHPVNVARSSRGELPVNGFWFWGGGEMTTEAISGNGTWIVSDDPLAMGVGRALDARVSQPGDVDPATLAGADAIVIAWTDAERALLGGDVEGWLAALQRFEASWAPILRDLALESGREIDLQVGGGACFTLGPGARRRFWQRIRPLTDWIQRE
ncbi:hypothetical protein [Spiribacter vilamensis]|uniref:Phosphoglycerate mutase n=1 Tax=Spiribacter vilamensis TaxID=531306 RepID=A0A4Q8CZW1_9GAMM|nr:hypothetical protein [Spiribacter vilamensis]RZU98480.1 hypothetical protein EV698_0727 [Spiribacter vilamensis]TVO60650.1 hypothetical protein FPL09_00295 [Spiribacter vilamensis]